MKYHVRNLGQFLIILLGDAQKKLKLKLTCVFHDPFGFTSIIYVFITSEVNVVPLSSKQQSPCVHHQEDHVR